MVQSWIIIDRILNPLTEQTPLLGQVGPTRHGIALLPSVPQSAIYPHLPHQQNEHSHTRREIKFQEKKHNRGREIYSKGNKEYISHCCSSGLPQLNQLQSLSI